MNFKAILSIMTLVFAVSAQAESKRLLVIMKSKEGYSTAQRAIQSRGSGQMINIGMAAPAARLALVNGHVEEGLHHIKTLIMKVDSEAEIARLRANPDVAMVEEEIFHPAPKPFRNSNMIGMPAAGVTVAPRLVDWKVGFHPGAKTPWGITAVKATDAWGTSHAGAGARIAVLDTGIDKDHPSLAGNFEKGADFVGDGAADNPFADSVGHGTHVAGTIAGISDESGFTGVAPAAKILAGRVCGKAGCPNTAIARGVNWGMEEKVDVISMSLGGMWSTPAERDAIAQAVKAGVTIVAASGNSGTSRVSYPAALPQVIAVGAIDDKLAKAQFSQYGPELAIVAPGVAVNSSIPRGTGRESNVEITIAGKVEKVKSVTFQGGADVPTPIVNTLVFAGLGRPEDFANVDVKDKFALVQRGGEITFLAKSEAAIAAGAAGVVIFNNAPGLIHGALKPDGSRLSVPVFMVEQTVGEAMRDALAAAQSVSAKLALTVTDYAMMDGTSMATPHVSGVVALMKAANKNLTPDQVKSILRSTAQALLPNDNNEFGAGLVNADAAVRAAMSAPIMTPVPPNAEPAPVPVNP